MKVTVISFGLFFLFAFCRLCVILAKRYSTNDAINGYNCNVGDVVFEEDNVSKLACASLCDGSGACLSVFYKSASLRCVGCKVWYNANEVSRTLSGSQYYEKQVCPNGTVIKRGRTCYFLSTDEGLEFDEAMTFCEEHGGYVVQAETSNENEFLKTNFETMTLSGKGIWLGLTDSSFEGIWVWHSTGSPLVLFNDWKLFQPNGLLWENCAAFETSSDRQWTDVQCDRTDTCTMCEKRIEG